MYIKSFHIDGFGPLTDVSVQDIPCAMAVFLGNNEAGKSSAMEFVRTMLMGVPTKRNYMTQVIRNSKGGSMKIHDMHHGDLDILRYFSQSATQVQIFDAQGASCKSGILGEIFAGMSRDVYRMVYGFNLLELQNISSFHGSEVFNAILGASFGLGLQGPVTALENIQERMDALYKSRGKNTRLQKLFDDWNYNRDALDKAVQEIQEYDILKNEHALLDEKLALLRKEKADIVRHGNEVQRFIGMWGQWNKWAQLQAVIADLPVASVSFPENAELVLERILEQEKIKHKNVAQLQDKIVALKERQAVFSLHPFLMLQKDSLQYLWENKSVYRQALLDNTALTVQEEQFSHVLTNAKQKLQEKWVQLDPYNAKIRDASIEDITKIITEIQSDVPWESLKQGISNGFEKSSFQENTIKNLFFADTFLQEFALYEARILEAQNHAQSARTALDYARRDLENNEAKRKAVEVEIQLLIEADRLEQEKNKNALDTFAPVTKQIELTKEALRVIPEKLQRTLTSLDSWKKQIDALGIRLFDNNIDGEQTVRQRRADLEEQHANFQLLNDGGEKSFYIHASDIIKRISELRPEIIESSKKITSEEEKVEGITQKLERIQMQIADHDEAVNDDFAGQIAVVAVNTFTHEHTTQEEHTHKENTQDEHTFSLDTKVTNDTEEAPNAEKTRNSIEISNKNAKDSLDAKSRALQKLQTINELRGQSVKELATLSEERKEAQNSLAQKRISPLALVPGVFCLLLGFPLLLLRMLSGNNFIVFDAVQSIVSFAKLFPTWTGTLYVPLWLPLILIGIASISIYLPLSRKSDVELDQSRLDNLEKKVRDQIENLYDLRQEEVSILAHTFDLQKAQQTEFFEIIHSNGYEEQERNINILKEKFFHKNSGEKLGEENGVSSRASVSHSPAFAHSPALQMNDLSFDVDSADKNLGKLPEDLPVGGLSLSSVGPDQMHQGTSAPRSSTSSITTSTSFTHPSLDVPMLDGNVAVTLETINKLIEKNMIYSTISKFLAEELQLLWEKEYADFIAEEQYNDIKAQNQAKRLGLMREKEEIEETLEMAKISLAQFHEEWAVFFEDHYFNIVPEAKFIEVFFFRIAAAEALQKRLLEINAEVQAYNAHIRLLRETVEQDFPEVYNTLLSTSQEINGHDVQDLHNVSDEEGAIVTKRENSLASELPSASAKNITTQDMLIALEKYVQNARISILNNKDISVREVALDAAIQAQKLSREHLENVQDNLLERQRLVDEEFMECVNFLFKKGFLSATYVKECQANTSVALLAKELEEARKGYAVTEGDDEKVENISLVQGKNTQAESFQSTGSQVEIDQETCADICALSKKPFLNVVKQVVEIIKRFDDSLQERNKIKQDKEQTRAHIDSFELTLRALMEKASFTPVYSGKVDYLEALEQISTCFEQEVAKQKEVDHIDNTIKQVQHDMHIVQADLDEIRVNLGELLKLAQVEDESALRSLIESQKQREQLMRSSLALEEPFYSVPLPKYIEKARKPLGRAFTDFPLLSDRSPRAKSETDLPKIFDFFEGESQGIWQNKLEGITVAYENIEQQEQEMQNACGALQAKCDVLAQSASLVRLKREQLEIEEEIKDTYDRWFELSLSKEIILKARKQYEQERQPRVIAMASEFFATITDNEWSHIVLSLDDKEIKVQRQNGAPVSPELLSQGAKEQLYLALRLAHIKTRSQTSQPIPILMDDILVNFDARRAEKTIETLNKLIIDTSGNVSGNVLRNSFGKMEERDGQDVQNGRERSAKSKRKKTVPTQTGQQILFYTCHEKTAQMLSDIIADTKIYLVENKRVRPA